MSVAAEDFLVFETYKDAPGHAFSKGIVSEDDKDSYDAIFQNLRNSINGAIARASASDELDYWNCRFNRNGGIQGQRPLDLWASIVNKNSDAFSRFPQIYVIASENGVEVGFSVTIHEDDYFNTELKRKNRSIIPIINAKLPAPDSAVVQRIGSKLSLDSDWKYAEKARQGEISSFDSFPGVIEHLKSNQSSPKGGGSVYKILEFEEVAESNDLLENSIVQTLKLFRPIMQMLQPTLDEAQYARNLLELAEYAEEILPFEPSDEDEGKKMVLREVGVRQGQPKFRDELLQAYEGRCAVTGCTVASALQAAHISPYNGKKSNHVSNGILLRADIHTLFDLGLIRVDPESRIILIVPSLVGTDYEQYAGNTIKEPERALHRPLKAALVKKLEMFPAE